MNPIAAMISVIPRDKRGVFGFTFVELMLVIVIITVLAGLAFPQLGRNLNAITLSAASAEIQSVVISTSQRSVVERTVFFIKFSATEKKYVLYQANATAPIEIKSYAIPDGITLDADDLEVYFYPDGTIDNVTISLTDKNGQTNYISTKGIFSGAKITTQQ